MIVKLQFKMLLWMFGMQTITAVILYLWNVILGIQMETLTISGVKSLLMKMANMGLNQSGRDIILVVQDIFIIK